MRQEGKRSHLEHNEQHHLGSPCQVDQRQDELNRRNPVGRGSHGFRILGKGHFSHEQRPLRCKKPKELTLLG
ncbi:hypothetical protein Acaty_1p0009 (plasmid) [Acidithiobacillus caldus ATCC 51756]|uniref:Uncharacterized protein n=1 Tax=Acidithiobacillus caldus (strain ATCC 51756 / DSM 8584 / KU) TaxID=637389 RepID=A0A059ZZ59_ACICK|nr:hypothetical protein Acaty_1p0009 [Acidithiobacillus caldus ATCC 51756]